MNIMKKHQKVIIKYQNLYLIFLKILWNIWVKKIIIKNIKIKKLIGVKIPKLIKILM